MHIFSFLNQILASATLCLRIMCVMHIYVRVCVRVCIIQQHLSHEQDLKRRLVSNATLSAVIKLLKRIMLLLPQKLSDQWKEGAGRGGSP